MSDRGGCGGRGGGGSDGCVGSGGSGGCRGSGNGDDEARGWSERGRPQILVGKTFTRINVNIE